MRIWRFRLTLLSSTLLLVTAGLALLLTACAPYTPTPVPSQRVHLTDPRAQYRFEDGAEGWSTFVAPGDQALFRVRDGGLEGAVIPELGYVWSLSSPAYRNAAIQAVVQQTQGAGGNGFGVLCRADASGNGYYFLISSTGYFSILKATSSQNDPVALVEWQRSDAIRQGNEANELLAVCVHDYLTFTINGHFVAEAHDETFDAGKPGVALGATEDAAWVRFDDIIVREADIAG